jgi:hypothetical protein
MADDLELAGSGIGAWQVLYSIPEARGALRPVHQPQRQPCADFSSPTSTTRSSNSTGSRQLRPDSIWSPSRGDSLDISSDVAVEAQIVVVSKYLRRMAERTRLITSSFRKGSGLVNAAGRRLAGPRGENPHRRPYLLVGPISWEAGLDAGLTQHWGLRARC